MTEQMPRRRPLLETEFIHGRPHVPFRDAALCGRCAQLFAPMQDWYYPSDVEAPICASCLENLKEEYEQWYHAMDDYYNALMEGEIDIETGEPTQPMTTLPF